MKVDVLQNLGAGGLCLMAVLAACSYDASKLRPADAPVDRPARPDSGADGLADADSGGGADADAVIWVPDSGRDAPHPDQADLGQDAADDAPADAFPDAIEVAAPPDDATDSAVPDDGNGGERVGSDGDDGEVGSGGTGGTGGGSGGTGGTAGSGGTGGAGGTGGTGGSAVDPDLVLWYKFDESAGSKAADSSGPASVRDGTLATAGTGGTAKFSTDYQVGTHALSLTPSSSGGGYVTVPAPAGLAPDAITIAVWVKLAAATSDQNWERIFDFGSGTGSNAPYMFLMARAGDGSNPVRFGASSVGHSMPGEQRLDGPSALPANEWHHIAIVLPATATPSGPYTGVLYVDGMVAASNSTMTIHLADVGTTTMNWLGRSPFSGDPFFYGLLDDFRIYKRALSMPEISALMALR